MLHYYTYFHGGRLCWTTPAPLHPDVDQTQDYHPIKTNYGMKKANLHGPFNTLTEALEHRATLINDTYDYQSQ